MFANAFKYITFNEIRTRPWAMATAYHHDHPSPSPHVKPTFRRRRRWQSCPSRGHPLPDSRSQLSEHHHHNHHKKKKKKKMMTIDDDGSPVHLLTHPTGIVVKKNAHSTNSQKIGVFYVFYFLELLWSIFCTYSTLSDHPFFEFSGILRILKFRCILLF